MNFNNLFNLFNSIFCAFVGFNIWALKPIYSPLFGITPTWESGIVATFVLYWVSVSLLAKDLQE